MTDLTTEFETERENRSELENKLDDLAGHWRDRRTEAPNPRTLFQSVRVPTATTFTVGVCKEVYFDHLKRIARRRERHETRLADGVDQAEKTDRVRYRWVKRARSSDETKPAPVKAAQADPHFACADLTNLVA